jgi:hypothetical protein
MAEPAPRHVRLREVACRTAKARQGSARLIQPPQPLSISVQRKRRSNHHVYCRAVYEVLS